MSTDTLGSRIARRLTTIAFLCCCYGGWIWLGRWRTEVGGRYWLASYAVAGVAMLALRAWLGGVRLKDVRRVVGRTRIGLGRVPRPSPQSHQSAYMIAIVLMVVLSASLGGAITTGESSTQNIESGPLPAYTYDLGQGIFEDGFEDGDLSEYTIVNDDSSNSEIAVASNRTRSGSYALYSYSNEIYSGGSTFTTDERARTANFFLNKNASFNLSYSTQLNPITNGEHQSRVQIRDGTHHIQIQAGWSSSGSSQDFAWKVGGDIINQTKTVTGDVSANTWKDVKFVANYSTTPGTWTLYVNGTKTLSGELSGGWANPDSVYLLSWGHTQPAGSYDYSSETWFDDYKVKQTSNLDEKVSGRVTNQRGEGVANATVKLAISKKPDVPSADQQLTELSNPTPSAWTKQMEGGFQLMGSSGLLSKQSGEYALVYDKSDLGLTYKRKADLRNPDIQSIEPGEQKAIVIGDTDGNCGIAGFETNEYNRQVRGCLQNSGNVTIEKLSSTMDVVDTIPVKVKSHNRRDIPGTTEVHYATFTFQTGYYRISVETTDGKSISYIVKVGTPLPDFNKYQQTVNNTLSSQAQQIRDATSSGSLVIKRVPTNETGYWNASVSKSAKVVAVTAMKAPGVPVDPKNLTHDNVTEAYNADNPPNASVYLPSTTKRVTPPEQNVDLVVREYVFPSTAQLEALQNRIEALQNKWQNLSMDDLPPALMQQMENMSRDRLASTWNALRGTIVNADPVREKYLELSGRDSVPTADELSTSELQAAIQNANLAITQTADTASVTQGATQKAQDTITTSWVLDGLDLSNANVTVLADYSNGTTRVVPAQYIEKDSRVGRDDVVRVKDFPLGQNDPNQVSFRLRVAGPGGFATDSKAVTNPTFSGKVPKIDAVEFTSLTPGPNDRVTVTVHPDSSSSFRRVTSATVFGPNGNTLSTSNITNGRQLTFTTAGAGVHTIQFTVETTGGAQFTDVVRIRAESADEPRRPSVYAHSGPLGTFAMVGDGFTSGDVNIQSSGAVEVVGVLDSDAEVPNTVDVYLEGIDATAESGVTVRIVRGESRESVRAHVPISVHTAQLNSPDDSQEGQAYVYVNGHPVAWDGSTRWGDIQQDGDGATIQAFTGSNGEANVEVVNNPGTLEQVQWVLATNTPDWVPDVPFVGVAIPGGVPGTSVPAWLVVDAATGSPLGIVVDAAAGLQFHVIGDLLVAASPAPANPMGAAV